MDTSVTLVQAYLHVYCPPDHLAEQTRWLLSQGHVVTSAGRSVRMVTFGEVSKDDPPTSWTTVPMQHVVRFLQGYLKDHWDVLRHAQISDPAFGVLALIEKWNAQAEGEPLANLARLRRTLGGMRVRGTP